jgi:hypothetical protein
MDWAVVDTTSMHQYLTGNHTAKDHFVSPASSYSKISTFLMINKKLIRQICKNYLAPKAVVPEAIPKKLGSDRASLRLN